MIEVLRECGRSPACCPRSINSPGTAVSRHHGRGSTPASHFALPVRFACLTLGLTPEAVSALCERINAPGGCRDLAGLGSRERARSRARAPWGRNPAPRAPGAHGRLSAPRPPRELMRSANATSARRTCAHRSPRPHPHGTCRRPSPSMRRHRPASIPEAVPPPSTRPVRLASLPPIGILIDPANEKAPVAAGAFLKLCCAPSRAGLLALRSLADRGFGPWRPTARSRRSARRSSRRCRRAAC